MPDHSCRAARSLVSMKWSRSAKAALVGLLGDHGQQHIGAHVLAVRPGGGLQLLVQAGEIGQAVVLAAQEAVVGVLGRELDAAVGLAGADDRDGARRLRQRLAVVELEEAAVVRRPARAPQLAQHLEIFRRIVVAIAEIFVAAPQAHLQVFELVPARDDIDAEPAVADVVDRRRHLGDHRRDGWSGWRPRRRAGCATSPPPPPTSARRIPGSSPSGW